MEIRKSTCLYLDTKIVETARKLGLNLSRVSENVLVEAIGRLGSPKQECMHPEVTEFYESKARVSFATVFPADNGKGAGLVPAGLLKMKKRTVHKSTGPRALTAKFNT